MLFEEDGWLTVYIVGAFVVFGTSISNIGF